MKMLIYLFLVPVVFASLVAFRPVAGKLISKNAHISFFSHTSLEDITANNYKVVSTLETTTGDVVYSVPMQSFEFEKALMQEHYNGKDFLNTKSFPKAKFDGKVTNISTVNFDKDGVYNVEVAGNMTIKETIKPVSAKGTITIKEGKVSAYTKFNLMLADYGIAFKKGKPSTNIAKEIEITVHADYLSE
ncbi:MAG: YceI family protein [Flammeovirgaceae bacterium]|nr:YceI family protein [Flammeovirgaceae bacterium]